MSSLAQKLFTLLEGKWDIFRVVANVGRLKGNAQFVKSTERANELLYNENGVFEFSENSNTFYASRKYIYRLIDDEDISVYFDEPSSTSSTPNKSDNDSNNNITSQNEKRLFHKFGLTAIQPGLSENGPLKISAVHLCLNDIYKIHYEFKINESSMNEFNIVYDVKGPNKSYVSETFFKRSSN
jgi:hypothetical protein